MNLFSSGQPDYDARILRAQHLAPKHAFAAEVLRFYESLAKFQKQLFATITQRSRGAAAYTAPGELRSHAQPAFDARDFADLLSLLQRSGPAPLANAAAELARLAPDQQLVMLNRHWKGSAASHDQSSPGDPQENVLADAILQIILQPHAEYLAARMKNASADPTRLVCPHCGSLPLLGVLRPEGDGATRFLMCSFCLQEWQSRRIFCAACAEEDEKKLPVYIAAQLPHIRVECCDTCKHFVRTIDLLKDGHAIPIVDDLSAIPLSLWADENGYERNQANLLGT